MRIYEGAHDQGGLFQIAIFDIPQKASLGFNPRYPHLGLNSKYRMVVLLNLTRMAAPIRIGSTLSPGYASDKFGLLPHTGEYFVSFMRCLPKEEVDVTWIRKVDPKEWRIRKLN